MAETEGTISRFRKKPIALEARQVTRASIADVADWCAGEHITDSIGREPWVSVPSPEGNHRASLGDWILHGTHGEFWAVREDIFAETYEPAGESDDPEPDVERLRNGAGALGKTVAHMSRSMQAARIEMRQNGPEKAMQWILNSLPDVDDNDPADRWDGKESAAEWLERTAHLEAQS